MALQCNIGGIDRILRVGISLLMIYFGFINDTIIADQVASTILGTLGLASMFVAAIGICPLYFIIGFNTCSSEDES